MGLVRFFFRLPWWGYLAIAGLLVAFAQQQGGVSDVRLAEIRAAQALSRLEPVNLADYEFDRTAKFTEGAILAQIVTGETTSLVKKTNGVTTSTQTLIVLADPAATETTQYDAYLILDKDDYAAFPGWATERVVSDGPLGPILLIEGKITDYSYRREQAEDALASRGRGLADDAVMIRPYLEGREAALAREQAMSEGAPGNIRMAAGGVALLGVGKLALRRRKRRC